ncbi:MAG: hypothetical protein GWP08_20565 [Nitrospiraceae bacterium]|nr:hypothetical protein [Nitrospiraceae bacterium]
MSRVRVMLLCALALGLGWAVRGHFGHEWGASWAGAVGALALVAAVNRKDWLRRTPVLAALGAAGWATGGMMSYGIVIGYCRGNDFANVAYGYAMLAVIGGLYGFIGGGLLGLGLETTDEKKPAWAALLTQMVAGAYLAWGLLIYQMEWFMTPPRSELWAACLGASIALAWYLRRTGFHRALRVAGYAALGGGFGFSVGNFFQTLGAAGGFAYNWWNVMEFTLGFCGGLGMIYAVLTSDWPECARPSKAANWLALVFVAIAIPVTNLFHAFTNESLTKLAEGLGKADPAQFVNGQFMLVWGIVAVFAAIPLIAWRLTRHGERANAANVAGILLFACAVSYVIFGYVKNGIFFRPVSFKYSDTAYTPILLAMLALWFPGRNQTAPLPHAPAHRECWKHWCMLWLGLLAVIAVITYISINAHEGLGGFHERF